MDTLSSARGEPGTVVRVSLPVPLFREFDYVSPAGTALPSPGSRVRVAFAGRNLIGICTAVAPEDAWPDAKPLLDVFDTEPLVGTELFNLARWLSDYYHHPLGEVFAACLPALARRPPESPRLITTWSAMERDDAMTILRRAPRQRALHEFLREHGPCSTAALVEAGFASGLARSLEAAGLVSSRTDVSDRSPFMGPSTYKGTVVLSDEQTKAVERIAEASGRFQPFLLQGITGSGKTEVYLQAMARIVEAGGQALMLVPEIGLTPQTIGRVKERFPDAVAMHSGLSDRERWLAWEACNNGNTRVLVGTRSSVFAQFERLQLIIVDEEHDVSYKQQDGLRYSARDVAVKRAMTLGIPVVLGSATPSFESLHNARRGRYAHLQLRTRPGGAQTPPLKVLDLRGLALEDGLAPDLIRRMRQHLEAGSQVLTYVNRRGFSPILLCATCGWIAECRHCDTRMTVHRSPVSLQCHHCGAGAEQPDRCPDGHATLMPLGAGTQRTEAALERLFPGYPVLRIDRDSTRSQSDLNAHLDSINSGTPMLLVGTQMLAKGHHFPAVTLVVIVNADGGFLSPDFRAPERTAQTIIQVAGRAGRAERPGEVWIQSMQPDLPALIRLVEHGYEKFAEDELDTRIAAGLPPASAMAIIRADAFEQEDAVRFLTSLKTELDTSVRAAGPAAAPIQRIANRHRQQLLLLADGRAALNRNCLRIRALTPPRGLRWSIDIDPYDGA